MAYGTIYTLETVQAQTSQTGKVYIKKRDYTGSSSELSTFGPTPVDIRHTPIGQFGNTAHWNLAESVCRVEFVDDGTGILSEVLEADDEQYQIVVELNSANIYTGFIIPDSYRYNLFSPGISSVSATDRLSILSNMRYASKINESVYTDTATIITHVYRCLDRLNLDLGFEVHCNTYPHLSSNPLSTSDDPFAKVKANSLVWRDEDDIPYNAMLVLEQICMAMKVRLFQLNNRWHFEDRRKFVYDSSGTDVYSVFRYTSAAAADSPTTAELPARAIVGINSSSTNQFTGATANGTTPYGSVSTIYFHGAEDALVGNPGFESAILANGSGADGNWEPNAAASSDASNGGAGNGGGLALRMDAEYLTSAATTFPDDVISTRRVDQTTGSSIAGGTGIKLSVSADWAWDSDAATFGWGDIYTFMRLQVGSYWLFYDSATNTYDWSTTPTSNSHYIEFSQGSGVGSGGGFNTKSFITEELLDGASAISGELYIELYGVVEDYNGTGTGVLSYGRWDNIIVTLIGADGTVFNEASRTTITTSSSANRSEPETQILLIGDGPTSEHDGALLVTNSAAADVSTTLWGYRITTASPGTSLHEYIANDLFRQFNRSRRIIRSSIYSSATSNPPDPGQYVVAENPNNTTQPDYTWVHSSWKPFSHERIWSGAWAEFALGTSGTAKCEIDIKPDSIAFKGLPVSEGLPCETLTPFGPPYLDFLWWAANESAASPSPENGVYKSTIPDNGGATAPWETDSDPSDKLIINTGGASINEGVHHLRVDREYGKIFYISHTTSTLYTADLDGSNATDSGITCWNFALDRLNQRVCIYNLSTFTEYDYDFNSIRTIRTKSVTVEGCPAYDQSGTYMLGAMLNDGGTTDRIYRITLDGLTKTNIVDMSSLTLGSLDTAEILVDEAEGTAFFLSTESPRKIYSFAFPGGGSLTTVVSSCDRSLWIDRLNKRVGYADVNGDLFTCDYDGLNVSKIYDYSSNLDITAADAGLS